MGYQVILSLLRLRKVKRKSSGNTSKKQELLTTSRVHWWVSMKKVTSLTIQSTT